MKLTFKNKQLMAIDKLLKDGEILGGIPKAIEMKPQEAAALVWEINALHQEQDELKDRAGILDAVKFYFPMNVPRAHPKFIVYSPSRPSAENVKDLLTRWFKGEGKVTYRHNKFEVPLIIKNEPKREPKKPSGDDWKDNSNS